MSDPIEQLLSAQSVQDLSDDPLEILLGAESVRELGWIDTGASPKGKGYRIWKGTPPDKGTRHQIRMPGTGRKPKDGHKTGGKKPAAAPAPQPTKPKEAWEMTPAEFIKSRTRVGDDGQMIQADRNLHRMIVSGAMAAGMPVPEHVASEYAAEAALNELRRRKDAQPRDMRLADYVESDPLGQGRAWAAQNHRQDVESALKGGKPVPPEVLADYPDLAEKYGQKSPATPEKTTPPEEVKPKVKKPGVYGAVVLDGPGRRRLLEVLKDRIPPGWNVIAHHMTVEYGAELDPATEGKAGKLRVVAVGYDPELQVLAVKVESDIPSANAHPHITIAVGPQGKAKDSNRIADWEQLETPIEIGGRAQTIRQGKGFIDLDAAEEARRREALDELSLLLGFDPEEFDYELADPPPGYTPAPKSKKGGFRKRVGDRWAYWYDPEVTAESQPVDTPAGTDTRPAEPPQREEGLPARPERGKVYNAGLEELAVDPERFQFKLNTDASGVTEELKTVRVFNPDFAGVLSVWRDPADGRTYVVNGHHRYELARRLGHPSLAVRFIQAGSAKEARAVGALVNIAEGRGTAVDAAKFFRDSGMRADDLAALGVSIKGKVAGDAAVLVRLNDRLFDRVARGLLDEQQALAVARHLERPELQDQLMGLLEKREADGRDTSLRVVEEMAREMAATPTTTRREKSLFGDIESEESLFVERNELKAHIRNELAREVGDWVAVSSQRRATRVTGAGNRLDVEGNKALAEQSERAKNAFGLLVNRKGAISDTLNQFARQFAAAKTKRERERVRQEAYDAVRSAVFAEAGITEGGQPAPERGGEAGGSGAGPADAPAAAGAPGAADAGRGNAVPAGLSSKVEAALARYENRGSLRSESGALFGGDDLRSRELFAKLPAGAQVVVTDGANRGRTGKLVREKSLDGSERIALQLDGDEGTIPVAHDAVEPLDDLLSWRTEQGAAPRKQAGLFGRPPGNLGFTLATADPEPRQWTPADVEADVGSVLAALEKDRNDLARAIQKELRESLKSAASLPAMLAAVRAVVEKHRPALVRMLAAARSSAGLLSMARLAEAVPPSAPVDAADVAVAVKPADLNARAMPLVAKAAAALQSRKLLLPPEVQGKLDRAAQEADQSAAAQVEATQQALRDGLVDALTDGSTAAEFRGKIREVLEEKSFLADRHVENIFRTNVMEAYSRGQMELVRGDPQVASLYPYAAYHATHDDRTREQHKALETLGLDGTNVYRAEDPVFLTFRPPWDFNCRCTVVYLTVAQAAKRGVREAQTWLETGRAPATPQHVPAPAFGPAEGYARELALADVGTLLGFDLGWTDAGPSPQGGKKRIWRGTPPDRGTRHQIRKPGTGRGAAEKSTTQKKTESSMKPQPGMRSQAAEARKLAKELRAKGDDARAAHLEKLADQWEYGKEVVRATDNETATSSQLSPEKSERAKSKYRVRDDSPRGASVRMNSYLDAEVDREVLRRHQKKGDDLLDGVGTHGRDKQAVFPLGGKFYVVDLGRDGKSFTQELREVPAGEVKFRRHPPKKV